MYRKNTVVMWFVRRCYVEEEEAGEERHKREFIYPEEPVKGNYNAG